MSSVIADILFSILLINFCIITGFLCLESHADFRERREKKQAKSNSKENGQ